MKPVEDRDDINEIRGAILGGESLNSISKKYGISRQALRKVRDRIGDTMLAEAAKNRKETEHVEIHNLGQMVLDDLYANKKILDEIVQEARQKKNNFEAIHAIGKIQSLHSTLLKAIELAASLKDRTTEYDEEVKEAQAVKEMFKNTMRRIHREFGGLNSEVAKRVFSIFEEEARKLNERQRK